VTPERTPVSAHRDGVLLEVSVQPRASRSEIVGLHDGRLRLRIAAPPVDGAANAEVIAVLAKTLGVSKSQIDIVSGQTGRRKRVLVRGSVAADISARLPI
jgi:uncharacterized protein